MNRTVFYAILERMQYLVALFFVILLNVLAPSPISSTSLAVFCIYVALSEVFLYLKSTDTRTLSSDVLATLSPASRHRIQDFPLPLVICEANGDVVWYDEAFVNAVSDESIRSLKNVKALDSSILSRPETKVFFDQKHFSVYRDEFIAKNKEKHVLYFVDITDYKRLQRQYNLSKPIVAHIVVDNYDDLFQRASESEKSGTMAMIDLALANWAQSVEGMLKKTGNNAYLFLFRNQDLSKFTEAKFSILDEIRSLNISLSVSPTLSIGIGMGSDTFAGNDADAALALDMALSRGGDQAVIKEGSNFEFFGGKTKGVEKRTKVKARVVAATFTDLLRNVDTVLVMGHQFSDFDSLGACVGIARIARNAGKKVGIVYDKNSTLAGELYQSLVAVPELAALFVDPETAMVMDGENTLVVVVDTHRPNYTTMPDLLRFTKHIAVIDHHRKAADFIENTEMFFHEPYASSVCEMVTEMMQYMNVDNLSVPEAEALFAGICLDTKNFTLRTSNYTFEASSFLRKAGADPVNVRRFFQTDMDTYMKRMRMVRTAKIYKDVFAVACWSEPVPASEFRIVASQAADEMLNIEGVCASFTLFEDAETGRINISGRSLGIVNVQLIAEGLGGGGHQTMAAAQLIGVTMDDALERLQNVIDDYINNRKI